MKQKLLQVYDLLLKHFGHRNWWPAETPFEVCVGAVLTQNTNWSNVEKALAKLRENKALSLKSILKLADEDLAELIKPSGYYNLKAKRLKALCSFLHQKGGSNMNDFTNLDDHEFRSALLNIYGVGEETADSILLYAFNRKVFVVDTYTKRIFSRLAFVDEQASYSEVQKFFMSNLPADIELYNDYHAQIVATGATYCKPKSLCENCPLVKICHYSD